jgi:hypothetical protein
MIDLDEFERRLRRPAAPTERSSEDPLVELARLVAGEGDPYEQVLDPAPDHAPAAAGPAWDEVPQGAGEAHGNFAPDFSTIEAGLRGSIHAEHPDGEAAGGALPAAFHAARYPENESPRAAPRSRKPLYMMAAVICLGIVGIGVSFAYKGRVAGPQQIATILAAPGPTKVQPSQQGDGDAGAQKASVLDKSAAQTAVALSDHREEPVDVAQIKPPAAAAAPSAPSALSPAGAASVDARPPVATPPSMAQFNESTGIAALIEPKKVKVVSVRPDGTVLPNDTPPRAAAPAAPLSPAAPPAKPSVAKSSTPKTTTHAVTPPTTAAAKPKPVPVKPTRVAEATPEAAPAGAAASNGSGFAVQLAAPATEKEAREASSRLEHQFAGALDGHQPAIHRAKVGEKDVYRIRVGGLSRDEAVAMCEKIKSSGGPKCFVAHN